MIERRTIGNKTYFVNVIEKENGEIIEQFYGDVIADLEKEKKKEIDSILKEEKEKLRKEKLEFQKEKKEWYKTKKDYENNIDLLVADPNFYSTCTIEEKEGYKYLKKNNLKTTKRALINLLKSYNWKYTIYPKIKEENDRKERLAQEKIENRRELKKKLIILFSVVGGFIFFVLCMVGKSLFE